MNKEEKLRDLVNCVSKFAMKNPRSDTSDYIRQVTEKIDDLYDGMMSTDDTTFVMAMLRRVAAFGKYNDKISIDLNVDFTTSHIKLRLQGETDMKKQDLNSMVFRRVSAAITTAVHGLSGITNQKISEVAEEYAAKITEDVFGGGKVIGNFSEYVDKFYEMDPETEDVLHNGTLVIDGMKVLIEDHKSRADISETMKDIDLAEARLRNRWCTVEGAVVEDQKYNGRMLEFVAVYDDGTKRKYSASASFAWIVKKDSIPRIDFVYYKNEVNSVYAGPTAKIVADLKSMGQGALRGMRVQTGKDGDIIPALKYLQDEGAVGGNPDSYDVIDASGNIIFVGRKDEVVEYLAGKSRGALEDCKIAQSDDPEAEPALQFLAKTFGDEASDRVDVRDSSHDLVFTGSTEDAVKWLRDRSAANSYVIYLGEGFDNRKSAEEFLAETTNVAVDYKHAEDEVFDGNGQSVYRTGKVDRMIEFLKALTPEQQVAYKVRQAGWPQCFTVFVYLDMVTPEDDE